MPNKRAILLQCEFKESGCDDPRCKIGACFLLAQERRLDEIRIKELEAQVDAEAEIVARAAFKKKGVRSPSPSQLQRAVQNPKVRAAARRRLESMKSLPEIKL